MLVQEPPLLVLPLRRSPLVSSATAMTFLVISWLGGVLASLLPELKLEGTSASASIKLSNSKPAEKGYYS